MKISNILKFKYFNVKGVSEALSKLIVHNDLGSKIYRLYPDKKYRDDIVIKANDSKYFGSLDNKDLVKIHTLKIKKKNIKSSEGIVGTFIFNTVSSFDSRSREFLVYIPPYTRELNVVTGITIENNEDNRRNRVKILKITKYRTVNNILETLISSIRVNSKNDYISVENLHYGYYILTIETQRVENIDNKVREYQFNYSLSERIEYGLYYSYDLQDTIEIYKGYCVTPRKNNKIVKRNNRGINTPLHGEEPYIYKDYPSIRLDNKLKEGMIPHILFGSAPIDTTKIYYKFKLPSFGTSFLNIQPYDNNINSSLSSFILRQVQKDFTEEEWKRFKNIFLIKDKKER